MSNIGKEGITPPVEEAVLSEAELQERAFGLISDFRVAFRGAKDFQDAAAQVYFGQLDYGYRINPDESRKVGFWRRNVFWGVDYTFTNDSHELHIDRNTRQGEKIEKDESITLRSKRFSDQASKLPPAVGYLTYTMGVENSPTIPTRQRNNQAAVEHAKQILSSFMPPR